MEYVIFGAVGVVAVLLLLISGAILGWKLHKAYQKHNTRVVQESISEEQLHQLQEEQRAFDAMLNYTPEMAYGLRTSLADYARKEG